MDTLKKDWKLFRERISDWQENYMEKLTKEYITFLSGDEPASKKFWELESRIKMDKRRPGVLLRLDKGEMTYHIVMLIRDGAIDFEDLDDFSDELKEEVQRILQW